MVFDLVSPVWLGSYTQSRAKAHQGGTLSAMLAEAKGGEEEGDVEQKLISRADPSQTQRQTTMRIRTHHHGPFGTTNQLTFMFLDSEEPD